MLLDRTAGCKDSIPAELERWIRLGVAEIAGDRLLVTRANLGQLALMHGSVQGEAASPAAGTYAAGGTPHHAAAAAREQLALGRRDQARAVLTQALLVCRNQGDGDAESELLSVWAEMALEQRSPVALDVAIYQVGRALVRTPLTVALETLLQSALHVEHGEADRARVLLAELACFGNPGLEVWRHAIILRATARVDGGLDAHRAALEQASAWAEDQDDPDVQARVLGWLGHLAYKDQRFAQAAELEERAAARTTRSSERLSCLLNGASAAMESGSHQMALRMASVALVEAARTRQVHFEGRAEWLLRAIAYRTGVAREPDLELVEAAAHLDVEYLDGLICLTEAAVAWRAGDTTTAGNLASRARRQLRAANLPAGLMLAEALELACTPAPRMGEIAALADRALCNPLPDISWQVLGMLASLPGGEPWHEHAIRQARTAPHPHLCRELLAPNEVFTRG